MSAIIVYLVIGILIGLLSCFCGRKCYYAILMSSVFIATLSGFITGMGANVKGIVLGCAVGLLLALISKFAYKAGLFLIGALTGLLIGGIISTFLKDDASKYAWILILAIALIVGICTVKWSDFFIILSTSINGASIIATFGCFTLLNISKLPQFIYKDGFLATTENLNAYINQTFTKEHSGTIMIFTAIIAVTGFLVQKKSNKEL